MKRFLSAMLALILLLGCLAGCSKTPAGTESTGGEDSIFTVNPDGLSLEEDGITYESLAQKAVVKTALAYLARSTRIQYDDTRLNVKSAPNSAGTLYRWQSGVRKSPEEYTTQHTGYTNCAAFTSDVYLAALGCKVTNTTYNLASITGERRAYRYNPTGKETAEEMATVQAEFLAALQPGDIIVVRRHNESGHAMLYVGSKVLEGVEGYKGAASEGTSEDGTPKDAGYVYDIIHSTGSSYVYDKQTEKFEKYGSIQITAANSLFDSKSYSYVFGKLTSLTIIRPLNTFDGEVPESTKNRMQYLDNVIAEKLSSHTAGMTVNPGGNIDYHFALTNKNTTDVTLSVKDTLPENTTLVSSENCTVDGANLSWAITVPAGKTVTFSYTVKVNENAQIGTQIGSDAATVGGVSVKCPKVYVGTSLTETQQKALTDSIAAHANSELRGMALANAIYNDVPGFKDVLTDDAATVLSKVFRTTGDYHYIEVTANPYRDAIAPGMFGGRYVPQRTMSANFADSILRNENNRTRLLDSGYLMNGDIIIASVDADVKDLKLYLHCGANLLDLTTGKEIPFGEINNYLMPFLSYNRFAVLRPSLMLDYNK